MRGDVGSVALSSAVGLRVGRLGALATPPTGAVDVGGRPYTWVTVLAPDDTRSMSRISF